jgi:hypothetical protein
LTFCTDKTRSSGHLEMASWSKWTC